MGILKLLFSRSENSTFTFCNPFFVALDGIDALGVTVHIISEKIDGGMILYRARPTVDRYDNFYSIGLKLSLLGCELFIRTIEQFRETDELIGKQQDLSKGNLYDFKFMRSHPEFYNKGWINLKKQPSE